jgi:acetolactate synthase small subunit
MAKKEVIEVKELAVDSNLNELDIYTIIFDGNEVDVSGNIANILIKKGKAKLK